MDSLEQWGASVSIKQCRAFLITPTDCIKNLANELEIRRFRLMSYWDEHEPVQGTYNFTELDAQIAEVRACNGVISLCIGARQPRWPESHYPEWALKLPQNQRYDALYTYISAVVSRYKKYQCVISWQLENEALNRGFGLSGDFNRSRLNHEFNLVKRLDPGRPIIMSTSNTWGIPVRAPRPDKFGFTLYQTQFQNKRYSRNKIPIRWWSLRAAIIKFFTGKASFIHELQAEPWGPKAIWEMSVEEQNKSMSVDQLTTNLQLAKSTNLYPIDLWGAEWWYWRKIKCNDPSIWKAVKDCLSK